MILKFDSIENISASFTGGGVDVEVDMDLSDLIGQLDIDEVIRSLDVSDMLGMIDIPDILDYHDPVTFLDMMNIEDVKAWLETKNNK